MGWEHFLIKNGIQFAAHFTQELLSSVKNMQVDFNAYKHRCNGLVQGQKRNLEVSGLRHINYWDKFLPQFALVYDSITGSVTRHRSFPERYSP